MKEFLKEKLTKVKFESNLNSEQNTEYYLKESDLESNLRGLIFQEQQIKKDNELINNCMKGFLNLSIMLSKFSIFFPVFFFFLVIFIIILYQAELQKKIKNIKNIHQNLDFEQYCRDLAEIILSSKDVQILDKPINENFLTPNVKAKSLAKFEQKTVTKEKTGMFMKSSKLLFESEKSKKI